MVLFSVMSDVIVTVCFFFFKQKTAYEMRISDWSSDVCSSDLLVRDAGSAEELDGVGRDLHRGVARVALGDRGEGGQLLARDAAIHRRGGLVDEGDRKSVV